MAITHARSGEVIDVRPFSCGLKAESTRTLVKTETLEIIRLVVLAGNDYHAHKVPGEITIQCLEGRCTFTAQGATRDLHVGHMIYLAGGEMHSLHAYEDSSFLLTILLTHPERIGNVHADRATTAPQSADVVQEASEESFPASDSPPWPITRP